MKIFLTAINGDPQIILSIYLKSMMPILFWLILLNKYYLRWVPNCLNRTIIFIFAFRAIWGVFGVFGACQCSDFSFNLLISDIFTCRSYITSKHYLKKYICIRSDVTNVLNEKYLSHFVHWLCFTAKCNYLNFC